MKLTIPGNVPSQKNRKIISKNAATGQSFLRSAPAVKAWQEVADLYLTKQFAGLKVGGYPIAVSAVFYFDNKRRHDLDNAISGVMDALVRTGIIEDDNVNFVNSLQIAYGGYDKINPRVEIWLDD